MQILTLHETNGLHLRMVTIDWRSLKYINFNPMCPWVAIFNQFRVHIALIWVIKSQGLDD